eukprot:CCRYP_001939-RA/>CCRYP_001939-RA protein AED:0.44 eAED:0.49 QI:0/0/0/1/0/0/3/0/188
MTPGKMHMGRNSDDLCKAYPASSRAPTPLFSSTKRASLRTAGRMSHTDVFGNQINFPCNCGTPTVDMITVKILINSVILTRNAKFMTIDIKDFYLNTPMERPEFMRLKLSDIPNNIIELYKLRDIAHDGYVFHNNSSNNASRPMATAKAKSTTVSGPTTGALFVLHSVWTTLASNMSEKNTLTISSKY